MNLRCRPGDLVLVIRSAVGVCNAGRVGTVERWIKYGEPVEGHLAGETGWLVRGRFLAAFYNPYPMGTGKTYVREAEFCIFQDEWLRPLRDKPGTDETLLWKDVPKPADAWAGVELVPEIVRWDFGK